MSSNSQKIFTSEKSCGHFRGVKAPGSHLDSRSYGTLGGVTGLLLKGELRGQGGQSLIEVIVAVTVGILVVSALVFATIFSLRNASFASNSAQATKLAQEGIEKLRTLRDRDGSVSYVISPESQARKFSDLFPPSPIIFDCPSNCYFYFHGDTLVGETGASFEEIPPRFQRQVMIEGAEISQKQFTVIVKWRGFANEHESRLTTILGKL